MATYILKRLLLLIPMTVGITFISFCVMQLAPGEVRGGGGGGELSTQRLTKQQREVMNQAFYLDQPLHLRYLYWTGIVQPQPTKAQQDTYAATGVPPPKRGLIYGDFGQSMETQSISVGLRLAEAIPITILLNFLSTILIYLMAIPIGIYSSVRPNTAADRLTTISMFMLYSMPSFWVAILMIKLMVMVPEQWSLPFQGIYPTDSERLATIPYLWECTKHLILPVIALSYSSLAGLSRYMRSSMLDVIRSDYVRTAAAKGLPERTVVLKHALRNALVPIITLFGGLLPGLLGGSIIIESIFGIPGMGYIGYKALLARDYTVLMADVTIGAVLVMIGFLISDLLYVLVHPRISFEKAK